jgi:hypothetical protein
MSVRRQEDPILKDRAGNGVYTMQHPLPETQWIFMQGVVQRYARQVRSVQGRGYPRFRIIARLLERNSFTTVMETESVIPY